MTLTRLCRQFSRERSSSCRSLSAWAKRSRSKYQFRTVFKEGVFPVVTLTGWISSFGLY